MVTIVGFHNIKCKKKLKFQAWFRLSINALKAVYQTKELVSVRGRAQSRLDPQRQYVNTDIISLGEYEKMVTS